MDYIYHGSQVHGLKVLLPRKSTHGNYVYGTIDKSLATLFSALFGDDMLTYLGRNSKSAPWDFVERVPGVFEKIFNTDASIYTLPKDSFKDLHTGFCEVLSDVEVPVLEEEYIENLNDAVAEIEALGYIKLYHYPNRPLSIPFDDSDLVEKIFTYASIQKREVRKTDFARLLYFHPELMDQVNDAMKNRGIEGSLYTEAELSALFQLYTEHYEKDEIKSQMIPLALSAYKEYAPWIISDYLEKKESK